MSPVQAIRDVVRCAGVRWCREATLADDWSACGFAAVMTASLAIGGHGLYREYKLGDAALAGPSPENIGDVLDDMDAQKRTAAAVLALVTGGEPSLGDLIIGQARAKTSARNAGAARPSRPPSRCPAGDLHDVSPGSWSPASTSRSKAGDNVLPAPCLDQGRGEKRRADGGHRARADGARHVCDGPGHEGRQVVGVVDVGTSLTLDYFAQAEGEAAFGTRRSALARGQVREADLDLRRRCRDCRKPNSRRSSMAERWAA